MCLDSSEFRKNGCFEVHVVVAKESDVTECMIHTAGEQIQGNEKRNFRDRGPRIGRKKGGRWASWTAQAVFAWTMTYDEPRRSRELRLYRCWSATSSADVSDPGTACLCDSGLWAPWHRMAMVACSMPAYVCSRNARKKIFQLFHFVQPLNMVHFLDATECRLCGCSRDWVKIDVWENPMVYAYIQKWSGLYSTMRSQPETAVQSSCWHFKCLSGHSCLSSACIVVGALKFTVTPAEKFVLPLSGSSISLRKHPKRKVCVTARQSDHPSECSPTLPSSFFLL